MEFNEASRELPIEWEFGSGLGVWGLRFRVWVSWFTEPSAVAALVPGSLIVAKGSSVEGHPFGLPHSRKHQDTWFVTRIHGCGSSLNIPRRGPSLPLPTPNFAALTENS